MAKPAFGTSLNSSSSFYSGLTNAWAILETSGTTLADSKSANTLTLGSGWTITTGSGGDSCLTSPAGMSICTLVISSTINLTSSSSWSLAWKMKVNNAHSTIIGRSVLNNDSYIDVNRNPNYLEFTNNEGGSVFATSPSMLDPFGTLDYAATSTGTSLSFYQNSTLIQSLNVSARGSRLTIDCFGGGGYTYTWFNGVLYYLFLWQGRVLNLTELTSFAANPWQLFGTDTPSSEASHGIMLAHM